MLWVNQLDHVFGIQTITKVRQGNSAPNEVNDFALVLPTSAWRRVSWHEGTKKRLASRFAAVRVRAAHGDAKPPSLRPEEWLLIEWPKAEPEPIKYLLALLPADTPIERLVRLTKMRWRIERDYQDLKQEVRLGHYEGRGWRGFHHDATLSIAT